MALIGVSIGVSLAEVNDRTAESAEQDQAARICRQILLVIFRKENHDLDQQNKDVGVTNKRSTRTHFVRKDICCIRE